MWAGSSKKISVVILSTHQILEVITILDIVKKFRSVWCYPITRAVLKASRTLKTLCSFSEIVEPLQRYFLSFSIYFTQARFRSNYEIAQN